MGSSGIFEFIVGCGVYVCGLVSFNGIYISITLAMQRVQFPTGPHMLQMKPLYNTVNYSCLKIFNTLYTCSNDFVIQLLYLQVFIHLNIFSS